MFKTFLGQIAPVFAALPSEAELDEDSRRSALDRNPGFTSFRSWPAWTSTDCLRGVVCVTMTFFSSFPPLGSGLFSFLFSLFSKGFANSTPELAGVGDVGFGGASRLELRGVEAGLEENLELILPSHELRRPPAEAAFISLRGPLVPVAPVLVPSPLRRLVRRGRLLWALEGSAEGVTASAGDEFVVVAVVVAVVVMLADFGSGTSVVVGVNAAFPATAVGGTAATGVGV
jgi:hypothetical protein